MAKTKSRRKAGRLAFEANILDGFAAPVILLDENRRVVDLNQAGRDLLGPGALDRDLAKSLDSPPAVKCVDTVLAGAANTRCEVAIPFPVSRTYEISVWGLAPRTPGKAIWAMMVLHDVTDAKMADQMRVDFVSNVSHELRSPLSSLVSFIETLRGPARDDPEARERFLAIMDSEAHRMTRLINDLLTLTKVETGEHIQPEGRVDLPKLIKQVATVLAVRAEEQGMTIVLKDEPELPEAAGDADELIQVFSNLLDNAINYGREGSAIRASFRRVDEIPGTGRNGVAVSIKNRGEGIDPEHLGRLTERFYRVDKGRSRSMGGTGLGLAIVKHIVNRHRGHVAIESIPGKSATFTVYLPVE